MRIKLNIIPQYFCSHLYARIDNLADEPYCVLGTGPTHSIRFWHNDSTFSLESATFPTNYDNDHFIEFKSTVPFSLFCMQLSLSKFNVPQNYNIRSQNCAYAAAFALQIANVKLSIPPYIPWNQLGILPFSKSPGFSLSPLDLYKLTKDFKIQMLRQNNTVSIYESTKSNLLLWRQNARNQNKIRLVDTIVSEMEQRRLQREEHLEIYLNVLIETLAFITTKPTAASRSHYETSASYFKHRHHQYRSEIGALYYNSVISLMLTWLLVVAEKSYSYAFESKEPPNVHLATFACLNILCLGIALFALRMSISPSTQSPTLLSNSMKELANLNNRSIR